MSRGCDTRWWVIHGGEVGLDQSSLNAWETHSRAWSQEFLLKRGEAFKSLWLFYPLSPPGPINNALALNQAVRRGNTTSFPARGYSERLANGDEAPGGGTGVGGNR